MKKSVLVLLHFFLWGMIFFTFFNIHNAINGFPKAPGYNPYADVALYAGAITTTFILFIPFYFGYYLIPVLGKYFSRKLMITAAASFGILYPVVLSIMDDGLRSSAIMQSVFLFAFFNVFLIFGLSFRSLFNRVEQRPA